MWKKSKENLHTEASKRRVVEIRIVELLTFCLGCEREKEKIKLKSISMCIADVDGGVEKILCFIFL